MTFHFLTPGLHSIIPTATRHAVCSLFMDKIEHYCSIFIVYITPQIVYITPLSYSSYSTRTKKTPAIELLMSTHEQEVWESLSLPACTIVERGCWTFSKSAWNLTYFSLKLLFICRYITFLCDEKKSC